MDLECELAVLYYATDKLTIRGSLVAALLSAIGYLTFAFLLDCPADTPYIHLYLTASYFCVGAATVGSYFACLTTGKLIDAHCATQLISSIIILPRLPDFIALGSPLTPRSILPCPILLLEPRYLPHSDPRIGRSEIHYLSRSNLPSRQSNRSTFHACSPTTYHPPTRPRRDGSSNRPITSSK
jgi:hypothetical protein